MHVESFLELLQSCPVFGDSSFAVGFSPNQLIDCTYNLLSFHENNIYSWNKSTSELSKINVKRLGSKKELCYQTLLLTAPPLGDVQQLQVSPSGQRLLLSGRSNVTVVDLPKRWGHHDAVEEEQQRVTCVSHPIGERFFRFAKDVLISQVKWHPDSLADTHLVVLCTDNYIRVYDISADLQTPSHVVPVGVTRSAQLGADTGVSFAGSLGGTAVAFDFGPVVPTSSQQLIQGSERRDPLPMYLLKGNGDVFALYLDVNVSGVGSHALRGPLPMQPAADDNYGTDACDLICMPSSPPVLVVATPGRLYHTIVLSSPPDSAAAHNDEVRSERSCYSTGYTLEPPDVSLYVYECAELEMALALPDDNSDLLAPIKLHRDPASDYRYFCTHAFGVHSLSLPLIPALQRYGQLGDESDEPLGEHPAVVAHLVCTRTLVSSPVCPVLGLTVIPHPPVTLVLLANNQLLALPSMRRFLTESAPDSLADTLTAGAEDGSSEPGKPADGGSSDSVEAHVRQMLERSSSQPLLHSSSSTTAAAAAEPPLEERLQLVVRSSRLLRCEYVQRQLAAGLWLRTRAAALRKLRDQQLRDLQQLQLWRRQLTSSAESLAERYHDLLDNQSRISQRVDALFERTELGTPLLSDAEKKMAKDMKSIKDSMNSLKGKVSDVKSKFEYQKREMASYSSFMVRRDNSSSVISNNQLNKIRDVLAKEGDQIADMVKTIHSAIKTLKL